VTEDEELATWIETANTGQGPTPTATIDRDIFDALTEAVEIRDGQQRQIDPVVSEFAAEMNRSVDGYPAAFR